MTGIRLALLLALTAVLAAGPASAGAKDGKVSPALWVLHEEYEAHMAAAKGAPFRSRDGLARVRADRVAIEAAAEGDPRELEAALVALGLRRSAVAGRLVSGELPIAAIPALATVPGLRLARPSYAGRRAGVPVTQGDRAMNADAARAAYGVSGAGVTVGLLSDSFDCRGDAARVVASGNLSPVTVLDEIDDCSRARDEGLAMLEIVHDIAPGATLLFASAFNGIASYANNILALRAAGAQVIVDDVFYYDEPMFQDGILAQAVDTVVSQGAAFFSAACNSARHSYESAFRPGPTLSDGAIPSAAGAPRFSGGTAHNFATSGPVDTLQRITVPPGAGLLIALQWDSPFFSVSGGAGSPNDVDVYLLNAAGTQVVAGAAGGDIGGDAFETFEFRNPTQSTASEFNLMIVHAGGPPPGLVKYIYAGAEVTLREHVTNSSTIFGHANAEGAAAVGAARHDNTPAFGVSPPILEPFSSAGPTPILFDANGERLVSPRVRPKPQVVGPDNVFTQTWPVFLLPVLRAFGGTSAAVAHAAGVGALLLERSPDLSPSALYGFLQDTAIDMGPPGFDFDSGFGLIRADAALRASLGPGVALELALNRVTASPGDVVEATLTVTNPGPEIVQDFYLAIQGPLALSAALCTFGDALILAAGSATNLVIRCPALVPPQPLPSLASGVAIPAGLPATVVSPLLSVAWPGGLPPGPYTFTLFTTAPGAFADRATSSDISGSASGQVRGTP